MKGKEIKAQNSKATYLRQPTETMQKLELEWSDFLNPRIST